MSTSRTWPTLGVETAAAFHNLPHGRITAHDGATHVFTAGLDDLAAWCTALGGRVTRQDAGPGVVLWTLDTTVGGSSTSTVRVHALALDTDLPDASLTNTRADLAS